MSPFPEDKTLKFKLWLLVCLVILGTGKFWEGTFNPFATENVDIGFEGLALTPDVRKNTFFSKKPSQTKKNVTSVIFMVEWKVNQFWNAQDFADSKLVYFSFYHKKYGSCDFFNKTSCFKKRIFTSV